MIGLETMRAEIALGCLPLGLVGALQNYDSDRKCDFDVAECAFSKSDWRHGNTYRLRLGLSRMTTLGVKRMARKHANLCGQYVSQHTGDLMTLQGLFYWNGNDELVTRILLAAWRKGANSATQKNGGTQDE